MKPHMSNPHSRDDIKIDFILFFALLESWGWTPLPKLLCTLFSIGMSFECFFSGGEILKII